MAPNSTNTTFRIPIIAKNLPIAYATILVILVSFITRLVVGYLLRDTFFERGNSAAGYNAVAFSIVERFEFAGRSGTPVVQYEPLYPATLAFCYKLFGRNWFGVTFIQGILFAVTSWFLFRIGEIVYNSLSGFIAAFYHSIYPFLFLQSLSVIDTTLYIFTCLLTLYVVVRLDRIKASFWQYGLVGVVNALCLLSRGSALAYLPFIVLFALFFRAAEYPLLKKIACLFSAALITLSPWLARNYIHTKKVMISTHGPFGLWQGNNEHSYEYLKNNISLDKIYHRKPPPAIYQKYPLTARDPIENVIVANAYKEEALTFIKTNPQEFLKLSVLKFRKFWSWNYNPTSGRYKYGKLRTRQLAYFLSFSPLLLSLPFGLVVLFKKSFPHFMLLSGILFTYTAAHMIVMGYSRLRLPLDPLLMILLGITISAAINLQLNKTANIEA